MQQRMGPLVHRSVHYGAIGLLVAGALFIIVNIAAPFGYPGFSIAAKSIGDLGDAAHTSWAWAFNAGAIATGAIGFVGCFLVWTAFPLRTTRTAGLLALEVSFVGAVIVGIFPRGPTTTIYSLPSIGIYMLLVASALGLILLAFAMLRDTRWSSYRLYTLLSGVVALAALGLTWAHAWGPLGPGGLERIALAPFLLWLVVAGIHLARIPTYSPPGLSVTA